MTEPKVHVVHATAPGCHWSWGYEAVMNRLRMVYGDQIALHVRIGCPYESREQWLADYGMSADEATEWMNKEAAETMGVPIATIRWEDQPENLMPSSLAAVAALHQGDKKGQRFLRALLRRFVLDKADPSSPATIREAAKEAGLDVARLEKDLADADALRAEYEEQGSRGPPVHVGFYNFVVWDGGNRRVILDYAFDPRDIEGAIDYLAGGALTKLAVDVRDLPKYLREHGLAPLSEIGRVFDLEPDQARAAVETHEKAGRIERVTLAGAPHWRATA